jgi:hypothetical protein
MLLESFYNLPLSERPEYGIKLKLFRSPLRESLDRERSENQTLQAGRHVEREALMDRFYNPMTPGWLGFVVTSVLFGLGAYAFYRARRAHNRKLAIASGVGLWVATVVMLYVSFGIEQLSGAIAGWDYSYAQSGSITANTPPAPSPSILLITTGWVIPVLAFGAFVGTLVTNRLVQCAVTVVVFCASFTVAAFIMMWWTLADDWALATSYAWIATGLSVLVLAGVCLYQRRRDNALRPAHRDILSRA